MKLRPLWDNVLIELEKPTSTEGGLIIPDAYQKSNRRAKVIACGHACTILKPGDMVYLPAYLGEPDPTNLNWSFIKESDILAVEVAEPCGNA